MKSIYNPLFVLLAILMSIHANGQDCSKYYPLTVGTKYEITSYDKKGKAESVCTNEVTAFSDNRATVNSSVLILKDSVETLKAQLHFTCTDDGITIDLNDMLEEQMKSESSGDDVIVEITGIDQVLPNELSEGQSLPDAKTDILIKSESIKMEFYVNNTNMKVGGKETLTTPAGTFDCVVITADVEAKIFFIHKNGIQKTWIAEGVGLVKEENYNRKGKLQDYQELTSFSNQ